MAIWSITNQDKKSAIERQYWTKDGVTVIKEEGFRWGTWTCESDERPNIDLDNPDGFSVFDDEHDWEMQEMMDGCWTDWEFPDDMDEDEQERIQALWDDDCFEGLENDGWLNDDSDHIILGPIKLVNEDTGETFE